MSKEAQPNVMKKFVPSVGLKTLSFGLIGLGVLGLIVGLKTNPERMWFAYLTGFYFVSLLGLGGFFFIAVLNVAKAGWSATIRRQAEGMTSFVPVMLGASLILLFGVKYLYPWADPKIVAAEPVIAGKVSYLNTSSMVIRMLLFGFGTWFFRSKIVGNSIRQDESGDETLTHKNVGWSIGYILFFAIMFSLFSVDTIMSLMPSWYSTIFGVYCFSGMFQSSLAFLILLLLYMKRHGFVQGYYNVEHIHDVAKFLKGFTVFWAYIAFSQFMLIWYANIPEETEYFLMRSDRGWMVISMALLVFKFIVPFLALLPRGAKCNETHLTLVCSLILVIQYIDVFWMVYPNMKNAEARPGFLEITILAGFVGIFLVVLQRFFVKNNLVAIKDPRIHEALNHHVTY